MCGLTPLFFVLQAFLCIVYQTLHSLPDFLRLDEVNKEGVTVNYKEGVTVNYKEGVTVHYKEGVTVN